MMAEDRRLGLETKECLAIQQLTCTAVCVDFPSTRSAMATMRSRLADAAAHSMFLSAEVRDPWSFVMD